MKISYYNYLSSCAELAFSDTKTQLKTGILVIKGISNILKHTLGNAIDPV